jgi:hypothetical protein
MRRAIAMSVVIAVVVGLGTAMALTKPPPGKGPHPQATWAAVACKHALHAHHKKCSVAAVNASGFSGYFVEVEENGRVAEIEKEGFTRPAANDEVSRLKAAGYQFAHAEQEEVAASPAPSASPSPSPSASPSPSPSASPSPSPSASPSPSPSPTPSTF